MMGNSERSIGVDGAPIVRTHQVAVGIEGIGSTTGSVTIIPISIPVTGVQSYAHGVLVTFKGVIFWAPYSIDKIGITVVLTPFSSIAIGMHV